MKFKITFNLVLLIFLIFLAVDINCQIIDNCSISGGIGIPMGKAYSPNNNIAPDRLFSGFSSTTNLAIDISILSHKNMGYGIFVKYSTFSSWKSKNNNNYFKNTTVNTIDYGPVIYINLKKLKPYKYYTRLIISPFLSYIEIKNSDETYLQNSVVMINNNQQLEVNYENNSKFSSLKQIEPGINISAELAMFMSENSSLFVRPGITCISTNSDQYPDKFIIIPGLSVGLTFGISNNKWFYLKNLK